MFETFLVYTVVVLLCAFGFRIRGGGFITFRGDTPARLVWCTCITLATIALMPLHHLYLIATALHKVLYFVPFSTLLHATFNVYGPHLLALLAVFPLSFLAVVLIPHVFAQSVGLEPLPFTTTPFHKWWPAAYEYRMTTEVWNSMSLLERAASDTFALLSVGLLRGLLVFGTLGLIQYFIGYTGTGTYSLALIIGVPVVIKTFGQSISYAFGFWGVPGSLQGGSWDFSELLDGVTWGFALIAFTQLLNA